MLQRFRYRHDAEGAAGLIGDASDAFCVSDHFTDAVARVPHKALGAQLLAVACQRFEIISGKSIHVRASICGL